MRENTLKQRLYAGKAAFGVMCTFPAPAVVEMLGHLGFDWILLDNEHGSITVDTAEACIAAAELTGIAPIVRPVGNKPEIIAPFLDRGAWGVQVPHVNTADEARAAVAAVKYSPEGQRGIFSGGRAAGYGFKGTTADYAREANHQTLVCLMLEEVEAIENLPEMVTVPDLVSGSMASSATCSLAAPSSAAKSFDHGSPRRSTVSRAAATSSVETGWTCLLGCARATTASFVFTVRSSCR